MPTLRGILEAVFWIIAAVLLIGGMTLAFGWGSTPIIGWLAPVGLLALAPMIGQIVSSLRRRRGAAVLSYVEQAVRLNLPLTRMLEAARLSEERPLSLRLGQLSRQLQNGQPLGVAIATAVPEVSPGATSMIAAAERVGRLPQALSRVTRQHTRQLDDDTTDAAFYRTYPFLMLFVIIGAVALICVFVMPKFETIFADFGLKLPPMTEAMLWAARELGPLIGLLAMVLLLVWFVSGLWRMFDPHMTRWTAPRRFRDRLLWFLPLTHSLARDRGLGDALDLIHQAVRGGHPIDRAVEQASALRVNEVLRERLAHWAAELRDGATLHQSAATAGLPRLVVEMLAPVRGGEQAADVLSFLSRYYDARFSRTRLLLRAASIPLIVFVFAIIVASIALALMTPLIALIDHIARSIAVHI